MVSVQWKKKFVRVTLSTLAIVIVTIILAASVASAYTTIGTNNRRDTHGWSANRRAVKTLDKNFIATHSPYLSQTQYAYQTGQGTEASMRYTEGMNRDELLQKVVTKQPQHLYICTGSHEDPAMHSKQLVVGRDSTEYINSFFPYPSASNWQLIQTQEDSWFHSALPGSIVLLMAKGMGTHNEYTMNQVWYHLRPWILVAPSGGDWRSNDNVRFMQAYSSAIVAGKNYRTAIDGGVYNARDISGRTLPVEVRYLSWAFANPLSYTTCASEFVYMKLSGERNVPGQPYYPYAPWDDFLIRGSKAQFFWTPASPPIGLSDAEKAGGYLNFHAYTDYLCSNNIHTITLNIKISTMDNSLQWSTIWDETITLAPFEITNEYVGHRLYSIYIPRHLITDVVAFHFEIEHDVLSQANHAIIKDFEFLVTGRYEYWEVPL